MPYVDRNLLEAAARTWSAACRMLGVKAVALFTLAAGAASAPCLAFLPDFGGPNGMVIGAMDLPEVMPDDRLEELAKAKGLFFLLLT